MFHELSAWKTIGTKNQYKTKETIGSKCGKSNVLSVDRCQRQTEESVAHQSSDISANRLKTNRFNSKVETEKRNHNYMQSNAFDQTKITNIHIDPKSQQFVSEDKLEFEDNGNGNSDDESHSCSHSFSHSFSDSLHSQTIIDRTDNEKTGANPNTTRFRKNNSNTIKRLVESFIYIIKFYIIYISISCQN